MEALTLLHEVSEAYRSLKNLALEAVYSTESGDENANQRNERRVRFFYGAPNRLRYEPCGKVGMIQVADGEQLHTLTFNPLLGGPECGSVPLSADGPLPHVFQAQVPEAFLYQGVDEGVTEARILRDEAEHHVVEATYEPSRFDHMAFGPAVFWVNSKNRMIVRHECELGHRMPHAAEMLWSRHIVLIQKMEVNSEIPQKTFQFTPPQDAVHRQGRCYMGVGGSGSVVTGDADTGRQRWECRTTHGSEDGRLVERGRWTINGVVLNVERWITVSEDGNELRIDDVVKGSKAEAKGNLTVRLR